MNAHLLFLKISLRSTINGTNNQRQIYLFETINKIMSFIQIVNNDRILPVVLRSIENIFSLISTKVYDGLLWATVIRSLKFKPNFYVN